MVKEDVTPYKKFCSRTNFYLKLASILGLDNVCSVWKIFLSTPGYIAWKGVDIFLNLLLFYHLEEWNLYMWVAESILCLLGLLCNCFINWNMILVFLKLWGTGQEHVFVFSLKMLICEKSLREENMIIYVQEQILEPVYPHSWMPREGCKIWSL